MEKEPHVRRAGRPRKRILTHEIIIQSALEFARKRDQEFSMAAISRQLGVRPQALHHYFDTREQLIAELRGEMTRHVDSKMFDNMPWWEAAHQWAYLYRAELAEYPSMIVPLATMPVEGEPESLSDYDRVAAAFERDDFPEHLIMQAIVAIESFVIGSALDMLAPIDNLRPATHEAAQHAPVLARADRAARSYAASQGVTVRDSTFELGLNALIAGLRALKEQSEK